MCVCVCVCARARACVRACACIFHTAKNTGAKISGVLLLR